MWDDPRGLSRGRRSQGCAYPRRQRRRGGGGGGGGLIWRRGGGLIWRTPPFPRPNHRPTQTEKNFLCGKMKL